ncbi:MAG: glycosyltransferase, partial [Candidatus Dadabacteria bacterium]|nr:glycosyltransferase [Candidatus Dadabacteria bacterium]NIT13824.1 glycosyltransferase [Candidatus Dadabacteria bacterium]
MNIKNSPNITAIITTKDRGESVCKALKSIGANNYQHCKVIIVDQSTDDSTQQAISRYLNEPDFTYIRSNSIGSSAGRNIAIENSETELIAITDDDCEVSEDWLNNMAEAFQSDERIGIVYGKVEPGRSVNRSEFITTYLENDSFTVKSIYDSKCLQGLSANMGITKSVWEKLNGFDEMLGAGVHFDSCEETDLNIRALLNGYYVHYSPVLTVKHHGYRDRRESQSLIEGYAYGNGALFAKHIKCGHYGMICVLMRQISTWAFGKSWVMTGTNT